MNDKETIRTDLVRALLRLDVHRHLCLFLLFTLLFLSVISPAIGSEEINIGVLASRSTGDTMKAWQPTAEYLTGEIPKYSFVIVPLDVDQINPAMEEKEVDFIITNPSSYVQLEAYYGASRIATMMTTEENNTHKVQGSVIFRKAGRDDIMELKDLRGRSFMGVHEELFTWQMAWRELRGNGIDPYSDFKDLTFSGLPQDLVVYAVRDARADAGVVRTGILESMASEGKINLTDFFVINQQHDDLPLLHSTRLYPEWAFVKARQTPDELAERVAVALLSMPHDSAAAKASGAVWTVPLDYQPVRELMKELRIGPYAEYGKISFSDVVKTYWYWIVIAIAAVLLVRAVEMDKRIRVEKTIRELIENVPIGIAISTPEGAITEANSTIWKMFGYGSKEDFLKLPASAHYAKPQEREQFIEARKKGIVKDLELRFKRKDGSEFWGSFTSIPRTTRAGTIQFINTFQDITERKRTEEKLRESEERFREFFEHETNYCYKISPDGKILDLNPSALRVLGYASKEEIAGKPLLTTVYPPTSRDRARELFLRWKETGQLKNEEINIMTSSGEERTVILNAIGIKDAAGKLLHSLSIQTDITERKKAEEKVHEASRYTRSLIEVNLDPLVTISKDGKITDVNTATESVTGVSREQLIGSDFSDYFTEPENAREGYQQVLEKGFVKDYPLAIRHVSGSITDVLYNAAVYRDAAGNISGVFAAARDITERKKAEEKVHEASRYTRSLIEVSLDPLVTISKDGKITDVNHTTELATGVPREKLIGSDFSDYFTEPEKAREGYMEVFEKGFVKDYPLAIRHVSGSITDVLYNASVYKDAAGNVAGVFAAARDITELKHAEDALRRAHDDLELKVEERTSELSSSLREKETLLKEIHHRVKNNLQIVSSMLQLQSTTIKDKQAIVAFREGQNRVNTMALIHEKLYRSRDLARINFAEYIEELATSLLFFYGINSELIKLKINVTDIFFDVNTAIPCGLIINELVSNSLKYAFPDGRKGDIEITLKPVDGKFILIVSDNGAGFPEGLDFMKTETLGLKLVNSLAKQLDGAIELDRSAGTRFEITFSEIKYKERG